MGKAKADEGSFLTDPLFIERGICQKTEPPPITQYIRNDGCAQTYNGSMDLMNYLICRPGPGKKLNVI